VADSPRVHQAAKRHVNTRLAGVVGRHEPQFLAIDLSNFQTSVFLA
jgi:hypothetical protein